MIAFGAVFGSERASPVSQPCILALVRVCACVLHPAKPLNPRFGLVHIAFVEQLLGRSGRLFFPSFAS